VVLFCSKVHLWNDATIKKSYVTPPLEHARNTQKIWLVGGYQAVLRIWKCHLYAYLFFRGIFRRSILRKRKVQAKKSSYAYLHAYLFFEGFFWEKEKRKLNQSASVRIMDNSGKWRRATKKLPHRTIFGNTNTARIKPKNASFFATHPYFSWSPHNPRFIFVPFTHPFLFVPFTRSLSKR